LIKQLKRPSRMVITAQTLGKIGAPPTDVLPVIYESLRDPYDRYEAVAALGAFGDAGAVPVLVKSLEVDDVALQRAGIRALGQLGPSSAPATDALLAVLAGGKGDLRGEAAIALGKIKNNPEQVVPALVALLSSTNENDRTSAATALGRFGEQPAAVDALIAALSDREASPFAAAALGRIGLPAQRAVPALTRLAGEGSNVPPGQFDEARLAALRALGQFGAAAAEAVPLLVELHANHLNLRAAAATALWSIDPAAARQAGAAPPFVGDEEAE
jgi:HEAT repeat protein